MSDWNKEGWNAETETPYVNWWQKVDGMLPANVRDFDPRESATYLDPAQLPQRFDFLRLRQAEIDGSPSEIKDTLKKYAYGSRVPLPKRCANPGWPDKPGDLPDWITDEVMERLPKGIPDDAVIVGVIDTGVALGHRAFRLENGETRVISAWQQTAEFAPQSADYLPFGEEWYTGDINGKLRDHSRNRNLHDRLDEDGFNRALRLVEPERIRGHRDLDHRAAHGTHIMDIAAGGEPATFVDADRLRMIVVNLPTQYLHGYAGNFLEFFAGYAVIRVFHLAEALWERNNPGRPGGYPVALNLAYGMMAGPKDGSRLLEKLMDGFVQARQADDLPTSICVPAGNENLARAVARLGTGPDAWSDPIPWRTLPSDRTSNHIEFWFTSSSGSPATDLKDYAFEITAPDGSKHPIIDPVHGAYVDLAGVNARLYCLLHPNETSPTHVHFMLATSPTLIIEGPSTLASSPAGPWKIKARSPQPACLSVYVQSDQSAKVQSSAGLRSYLDHPCYEPYLPNGRIRDTFSYEPGSSDPPEDQETSGALVTRKGSHNALATTTSNSALAGFRRSDGRPADYSATSYPPCPQILSEIQAAYPTDDSPALYGVLAAGARDGSSVAFRGTSMAAAMATRAAANAMLAWTKAGRPPMGGVPLGSISWHEQKGSAGEQDIATTHPHFGATTTEKHGQGRIVAEDHHRAWRKAPR